MIQTCSYVLVPTPVTDAMLVSCTVAEPAEGGEPSEVEWNAATNYEVGQEAIRTSTHKRYKRLVAGVSSKPPEDDLVPPNDETPANWLDIGATNRWAQFDKKVGTKTTFAGDLTLVLRPGSVEGLALLDLRGTSAEVVVYETPGGAVAYSHTISLDDSLIASVYDWMYGDYRQRLNVVLTDLPGQYPSAEIAITVRGTSTGIGATVLGRVHELGATDYGAGAGIINWGKVSDDGFGNRTWIEGEWANRVTLPISANTSDMPRLHRQLAAVRSTPCVYIGSTLPQYEPLVCYGVYRDLYITVPYTSMIQLNLEIDGLNNI